jgi:leucyl-tRNA synthetase
VAAYIGGNEHAVLHLLYARFWHKVLFDAGYASTKEPFQRLFHQGMIHKPSFRDPAVGKYYEYDKVEDRSGTLVEGKPLDPLTDNLAKLQQGEWYAKGTDIKLELKLDKMSKSRYNVINPDDMCAEYGADAMRLYELFMGPLEDGTEWETNGVVGTRRFLDRVWRLLIDVETDTLTTKVSGDAPTDNKELERALHGAIKKVTQAVTDLRFNTAVSEMMVFVNEATKASAVPRQWFEMFVKILSPFAPHISEELRQRLGYTHSIAYVPWPEHDESKLTRDTMLIAVQVSGKVRGQIEVPTDAQEPAIIAAAKADDKVQSFIAGKAIKREIYVKGRLVNLVV